VTILPEGMDPAEDYDKWGKVKYPRTPHLPWSPGRTSDDRVLADFDNFVGREVVITEKLDGENTTIYRNGYHARSLDTDYHPTRTWVQNLAAKVGWELPEGWRICGENLAGTHAIKYTNLPSYFFVFSIWTEHNVCLSWSDTVEYSRMLGLETVPVIHKGPWDANVLADVYNWRPAFSDELEGYVVRLAGAFPYGEFGRSVAKFVRANHVVSGANHWRHTEPRFNELA
jgi:hypothetical protein